jgi:hypothetical protein
MIKVEEPSKQERKNIWIADVKAVKELAKYFEQDKDNQYLYKVPDKIVERVKQKCSFEDNDKENG